MSLLYSKLPKEKINFYLSKITKANKNHGFNPDHVTMLSMELSFLPEVVEIICEDFSSTPFKKQIFLFNQSLITPLIYSENPIKDNDIDIKKLIINEQTCDDYLHFYLKCLILGGERIQPIRHADDIEWQDEISPLTRQSLEKDLRLYPKMKKNEKNMIIVKPCVFQQSIMIITFEIKQNGEVEVKDRYCLIEDLPIKNFS